MGRSEMDLHKTLRKFSDMATLKGNFFLCRQKTMEIVSRWLKDVDNMSSAEKFALCMSPVNENCMKSKNVFLRYVEVSEHHLSIDPKCVCGTKNAVICWRLSLSKVCAWYSFPLILTSLLLPSTFFIFDF